MPLHVYLGGARSGKSRAAVDTLTRRGGPAVFIATAERRDPEMAARIDAHRLERPSHWATVEEPLDLETALAGTEPEASTIVDCLTLWVANLEGHGERDVPGRAARAAAAAASRPGLTIAVTNEVGSGIVPGTPIGRRFRDVLGEVNAAWVKASDRAFLFVGSRAVLLSDPTVVLDA